MIRRAEEAAKAWPRSGLRRPDGNDQTQQTGLISDSNFSDGFWHPYSRHPSFPPARIVCFSEDVHVQVTLQLPLGQDFAERKDTELLGGYDITFIEQGTRHILAAGFAAADGGALSFHTHSWDPRYVEDISSHPDSLLSIDAVLADQVPRRPLPADPKHWPIRSPSSTGSSQQLSFDHTQHTWHLKSNPLGRVGVAVPALV
ncbi:hypothetical protein WJX73_000240 [Symbiochloris irregularis]|uniref:Uncharacterized protein n=1 Tax=Symbiochloris irregularis TaxID=706552 RepID=A0AAW1PLH9_9CHLO